jgi:hypothetical protein
VTGNGCCCYYISNSAAFGSCGSTEHMYCLKQPGRNRLQQRHLAEAKSNQRSKHQHKTAKFSAIL